MKKKKSYTFWIWVLVSFIYLLLTSLLNIRRWTDYIWISLNTIGLIGCIILMVLEAKTK